VPAAASGDPSANPTTDPGALAGGVGPAASVIGGATLSGPILPLAIALAQIAVAGGLLIVYARRRRGRGPDRGPLVPRPSAPSPDGLAFVAVSADPNDEPDPLLPDEVNMPRWRRPSVQAARFSQPARRPSAWLDVDDDASSIVFEPVLTPMPPIQRAPRREPVIATLAQERPAVEHGQPAVEQERPTSPPARSTQTKSRTTAAKAPARKKPQRATAPPPPAERRSRRRTRTVPAPESA
jgi:hypothetical protein